MENSLTRTRLHLETENIIGRPNLRERMLIRLFSRIRSGRLTVLFPSGVRRTFGRGIPFPHSQIRINDLRIVSRMLVAGDLGLAESFMDGDWETPDLTSLLSLGVANADVLNDAMAGIWITKVLNRIRHARRANTRKGSRRNIAAHYDLGNGFYRLWLDDSMSYSSGLFSSMDEPLAAAQRQKYLRLANKLDLRPGDRVLEIGCGWGGFAEIAAAEFGCKVVGLTLSTEQAAFARARMVAAGLAAEVDIRVQDYRDVSEEFDKIVSIEMFEAVGEDNWKTYFNVLDRCLKPGGRAALQSITIADEYFDGYRRNPDFIQRYIFPGGMLPSPSAFEQAVADAGLTISDSIYFGGSYAETLRRWDKAFRENWPAIEALGFDERFRRMWRFYLCYSEVGFDKGQIDVGQFVIERP